MTEPDERLLPMDVVRGAAVLGMAVLIGSAIALPSTIQRIPDAAGDGVAGAMVWLASFALLDGKIVGLFAMLFGASTLLVIDRAEMEGGDGFAAQRRRLLWLMPIGAAHYLLVWPGAWLMLLALAGWIALRFAGREPLDLLKWALAFFALQLLISAVMAALAISTRSPEAYSALLEKELLHELVLHRGGYVPLALARLAEAPAHLAASMVRSLFGMLGFMLLGMAMAMGGFFTGQWSREQYARTARHAYLVGLLPVLLLGAWALLSGDPRIAGEVTGVVAFPFAIPIAIGHAALLMLAAMRGGTSQLVKRVAAVGRTALSNYLLCTILLATLAYGFGLGLYGRLDRMSLLGIAIGLSALMLLWSPHWLRLFGAGPGERLWHALRRIGRRAG
ncbi:MAG TPA: DUF418 domain-containing protein [Sphingobium sp.]|nr:DUF418 domain-containing protein [Sphingobium sp.]